MPRGQNVSGLSIDVSGLTLHEGSDDSTAANPDQFIMERCILTVPPTIEIDLFHQLSTRTAKRPAPARHTLAWCGINDLRSKQFIFWLRKAALLAQKWHCQLNNSISASKPKNLLTAHFMKQPAGKDFVSVL